MSNSKDKLKLIINGCLKPAEIRLIGRIKDKYQCDQAEDILVGLEKLFKKHRLILADIDEISAPVFCQEGSYTGHRVGLAIVNTLNFIQGRKKLFFPRYGQKPKVTLPSSRVG